MPDLEVQETIWFGLTAAQLCYVVIALTLGVLLVMPQKLPPLPGPQVPLSAEEGTGDADRGYAALPAPGWWRPDRLPQFSIPRLAAAGALQLVALTVALARPAGLPLLAWLRMGAVYAAQPKRMVWAPVPSDEFWRPPPRSARAEDDAGEDDL